MGSLIPLICYTFSSLILFIMSMILLVFLKSQKSRHLPVPLPPGPKPWPIVGCLPTMLKNKPVFRWIHKIMKEMGTEIACIRLGNVHVVIVACPKISCQFLKAQDTVFASRPLSMPSQIASSGYSTTALVPLGEQWKKMKRVVISQLLSPSKDKFFYRKRQEEADHLVRFVYRKCTKSENDGLVNVRLAAQHYCGNVIRRIVFNKRFFGEGKQDGGPGFEEEEHVDAIFTMLAYVNAFCVSDFLPCLIGFDADGHENIVKKAKKIVRKYHDPIIEERFQQWRIGSKKEVEDLLDMFITLKDENGNSLLSKEEIEAQINEIMMATVDNPSNAVEWTLAEMLNEPKIMAKAVEEIDRVVGKERLVEESDIPNLNYIKACAREAFRLHPVAPFNIPHVSIDDTIVENYFIPKGSHVLISRVGLGRNHKSWDEPEKFKPERHLTNDRCDHEVMLTEPHLKFMSFSIGKRGCPGASLGTSMTVMLFARLLQGFTWSLPSNLTNIDLTESRNSLALNKPLAALANPRLPPYVYPS